MRIDSMIIVSIAKAPWRRSGRSASSHGQDERRIEDVGGFSAPAAKPHSKSTTSGALASVDSTSAPSALACPTAHGKSTRHWPSRSTARPVAGAPIPTPAASEPATPPAIANEPVCSRR
jgi:hypothetical protein